MIKKKKHPSLFMSLNYIYDTFGIYRACTRLQWISHPSENEEYIQGGSTAVFFFFFLQSLWSSAGPSQGHARGFFVSLTGSGQGLSPEGTVSAWWGWKPLLLWLTGWSLRMSCRDWTSRDLLAGRPGCSRLWCGRLAEAGPAWCCE